EDWNGVCTGTCFRFVDKGLPNRPIHAESIPLIICPFEPAQLALTEAGICRRGDDSFGQRWQRIENSTNLIQVIRVRQALGRRATSIPDSIKSYEPLTPPQTSRIRSAIQVACCRRGAFHGP